MATNITIDSERLTVFSERICASVSDFPYLPGYKSASPFKKIAQFAVLFVECAPITDIEFANPDDKRSQRLARENAPNAFFVLSSAVTHLQGATFRRGLDGKTVELEQAIALSAHTKEDFYDAYRRLAFVDPADLEILKEPNGGDQHFLRYQQCALLFEQMVYRTNVHAMYPAE